MIPKVIHYCWFGGNPLSELAQKCIASWKKYCPDFEIIEWNESNFDLNCCDYVKEAYEAKKWAFVSDYARFWILYNFGGLYFDTDVELIHTIDDIIEVGPFMGFETDPCEAGMSVAPGLGLAVNANHELYKEIMTAYEGRHFINPDGSYDQSTVVDFVTKILVKHGLQNTQGIQSINGIYIYPEEYFCPINYETGKITITEKTISIHHYSATWLNKTEEKIYKIGKYCVNRFGKDKGKKISRILDFPFRVKNKMEQRGFIETMKFAAEKFQKKQ